MEKQTADDSCLGLAPVRSTSGPVTASCAAMQQAAAVALGRPQTPHLETVLSGRCADEPASMISSPPRAVTVRLPDSMAREKSLVVSGLRKSRSPSAPQLP